MGWRGGGEGGGKDSTYGVPCCIFLFCGYDLTGTLGSIKSTFATDDSFTLRGAATGLAADFSDGVPIVGHNDDE